MALGAGQSTARIGAGGPPRSAAWSTWSGPEGSSHSHFPRVPGFRLAHLALPPALLPTALRHRVFPDMNHLALARKWRPRDFDSLVGQEHVVRALSHALETKRLHHAYLFTGTRGVGKTTIARILAKALNCERGVQV